ncbi:putative endonuclease LCL3 [Massariosphaeria phaeospora]|uniref:Probable endonuclease LCL3 n=1 Tax=Massariosphaeria phaeospora TaxID=100035 RepID=A0A7C8MH52_9PLEO|nr:putative endonuclease LCL3 [Massariosphaeria phaeospora]
MRWPWTGADDDEQSDRLASGPKSIRTTDWAHALTEPRTLIPSVALTITTIAGVRLYKSYLRRIPNVNHIKPGYFRRRSLFGRVTSVGDADNFRIFHIPGGRLAGWGWLPWKSIPTTRDGLAKNTIHVRIAGVDAPELAHWGREAQPHSKEALDWLTNYILNKHVRVYIYKRDQYDRVVAQVFVRKWLLKKDVGLEMLKTGLAAVYEAKTGSEFGDFEQRYRDAEKKAKEQQVGMWAKPTLLGRLRGESTNSAESPREYKNRHTAADKQKKAS